MLIPSERHTKKDIALWAELEAADVAHGGDGRLAEKVEHALEVVRRFADGGPFYVGVSGGKDSMVVADLCLRVQPSTLVYARAIPTGNPDSGAVFDAFDSDVTTVDVDYRPLRGLPDSERLKRGTRLFMNAFKPFGERRVMGIRQAESSSRSISAAVHGEATQNVCRPILRWTDADVFAYLAVRDLPVHPAYAMLGGGRWPRDKLRVDELKGMTGDGMGRSEWEREYYGDVLARIEAMG